MVGGELVERRAQRGPVLGRQRPRRREVGRGGGEARTERAALEQERRGPVVRLGLDRRRAWRGTARPPCPRGAPPRATGRARASPRGRP